MKFFSLLIFLFLTGCGLLGKGMSPYGPWHGFIYEETAKGEETRIYHGDFEALTNCMDLLQLKTKYNGYAYFCGYNCSAAPTSNSSFSCEKIMGSPLNSLPTERWKGT